MPNSNGHKAASTATYTFTVDDSVYDDLFGLNGSERSQADFYITGYSSGDPHFPLPSNGHKSFDFKQTTFDLVLSFGVEANEGAPATLTLHDVSRF